MFTPTMQNCTIDGWRPTQERWDSLDWTKKFIAKGFEGEDIWKVPHKDAAVGSVHRVRPVEQHELVIWAGLDTLVSVLQQMGMSMPDIVDHLRDEIEALTP